MPPPKKVKSPGLDCPPAPKGSILAKVEASRPGSDQMTAVADVQISVSGPSAPAKPKKTSSSGQADFSALNVGSYTVSVGLPGKMADYYQAVPPPQTKDVTAGKTTPYYFALITNFVDYFATFPDQKAAKGLDFSLKVLRESGKTWENFDSGKIGAEKVSKDFVPRGTYRLELKYICNCTWGAGEVVVDEPIDMHADTSGFDPDTAVTFDVLDASDLKAAVGTASGKVDDTGAVKASWTPAKNQLANLKGNRVAFRVKAGPSVAFSPALNIVAKEKVQVVGRNGSPLNAHINFRFTGGSSGSADAAGGSAEVKVPWGEQVLAMSLPQNQNSRVSLEPDGGAAQKFQTPV